jgi:hypothetical protein
METDCDKAIFVNGLKAIYADCLGKSQFLTKVIEGEELVSFSVIDRCAEVYTQVKQLTFVFSNKANNINYDALQAEIDLIEKMRSEMTKTESSVTRHWTEIKSWDVRAKYPGRRE